MKNELYHYGIKGMKWGVRRYQNADGSLTPKGKERYRDTKTTSLSGVRRYQNEDGTLTDLGKNRLRGWDSSLEKDIDMRKAAERTGYTRYHNKKLWADGIIDEYMDKYGSTPINRLTFEYHPEDEKYRGRDYVEESSIYETSLSDIYDAYNDYRESEDWD